MGHHFVLELLIFYRSSPAPQTSSEGELAKLYLVFLYDYIVPSTKSAPRTQDQNWISEVVKSAIIPISAANEEFWVILKPDLQFDAASNKLKQLRTWSKQASTYRVCRIMEAKNLAQWIFNMSSSLCSMLQLRTFQTEQSKTYFLYSCKS